VQALEGEPEVFEEDRKGEKALNVFNERQPQELFAEIGQLNTQLTWLN